MAVDCFNDNNKYNGFCQHIQIPHTPPRSTHPSQGLQKYVEEYGEKEGSPGSPRFEPWSGRRHWEMRKRRIGKLEVC